MNKQCGGGWWEERDKEPGLLAPDLLHFKYIYKDLVKKRIIIKNKYRESYFR
jgi:hypothetical protein